MIRPRIWYSLCPKHYGVAKMSLSLEVLAMRSPCCVAESVHKGEAKKFRFLRHDSDATHCSTQLGIMLAFRKSAYKNSNLSKELKNRTWSSSKWPNFNTESDFFNTESVFLSITRFGWNREKKGRKGKNVRKWNINLDFSLHKNSILLILKANIFSSTIFPFDSFNCIY